MSTTCKKEGVMSGQILSTVGWQLFIVTILILVVFMLIRAFTNVAITDIYFIVVFMLMALGAIAGMVGASLDKSCEVKKMYTEIESKEQKK